MGEYTEQQSYAGQHVIEFEEYDTTRESDET